MRRARGFSLLEVVIAISILAVSLTALLGHQGVAIQMSDYSNRVSQAALLGQSKMLDVEYLLIKDGMEQLDDCEEGDFRDEGFRRFRWKACAYKLELQEGAGEQMTERFMSMLSGSGLGGTEGGQMSDSTAMAMGQMGMALGAIPTFIQQLEDKVRKVRLEISWKDMTGDRQILLERFVTTLGADATNAPPPKDGQAALDPTEAIGDQISAALDNAIGGKGSRGRGSSGGASGRGRPGLGGLGSLGKGSSK